MKYELPKEFMEKWLVALRDGGYGQCGSQLHNGDGYCCLGVACAFQGIDIPVRKKYSVIVHKETGLFKTGSKKIPKQLYGEINENALVAELVTMNDDYVPFKVIADWIEENVKPI